MRASPPPCFVPVPKGEQAMPQTIDSHITDVARISGCYGLLSACFCFPEDGQYVDPETIELLAEALAHSGSAAAVEAAGMVDGIRAMTHHDLLLEYTRLFIGPRHLLAPPYGSVHMEESRRLMGESTVSAVQHYLAAGVNMDAEQQDIPDHIAVELEFMGFLAAREVEALEAGSLEDAREWRVRQRRFLAEHLGSWVPVFAERLAEDTDSPYFLSLGRCTAAFVGEHAASLEGCISGA